MQNKPDEKVVVVGLGYVGTPIACLFAKAGFLTVGIDADLEKIGLTNDGRLTFKGKEPGLESLLRAVVTKKRLVASVNFSECKDAQAIIVCVDTPIDFETKKPNYKSLKSALKSIAKYLAKDTMVVIESTLAPLTMQKLVKPVLEANSNLKAGKDFYLAHVPERVMPGRLIYNLLHYNRVIGGIDKKSAERVKALYQKVFEVDFDVTDCLTAELTKTVENTSRDVQIAFANEVALICEKLGADVFKVRDLVNKCPFRDMRYPGAGVGGPCLTKDPWLLMSSVNGHLKDSLVALSRYRNDSMPDHVVKLTKDGFAEAGKNLKGSKIALLGLAYSPNSYETRNSPGVHIAQKLLKIGAKLAVYDPHVEPEIFDGQKIKPNQNLEEVISGSDCIVLATPHDRYKRLSLLKLKKLMKKSPIIIDSGDTFDKKKSEREGFIHRGIGKGYLRSG